MKHLCRGPRTLVHALTITFLLVGCIYQGSAGSEANLPWEVWNDLRRLPQLRPGHQVLLRSSHCPEGCRYDRHSAEAWRYLRIEGDEGVIFEEHGAGAITRIWVTQGHGVSDPLSPGIRLRIYLDGAATPAVDLPLPALFDGTTPPFSPPLVGDRLVSSGGNFSYVPIPYRSGCKVTLEGAHDETLWFQFSFDRLASPEGVRSFDGSEDLGNLRALLNCQGCDPWLLGPGLPASAENTSGGLTLSPGDRQRVLALAGPELLTALLVDAPPASWDDLSLELFFDGELRVAMSLSRFFAVGRGGLGSTRSLFLGVDLAGRLYSYFPMPFSSSCELYLRLAPDAPAAVNLDWGVRRWGAPPLPDSAVFTAQLHQLTESTIGLDIPLLELDGSGKLVGLFAELGSVGTPARSYLEGDERIFVDGSWHPGLHGTGTEDLFNGGFYFDQGDFQLALHGSPYRFEANGENGTAMYRLMLDDGATWGHRIRAGLEGGPESNLAVRATTVAYAYVNHEPTLWPWSRLDLGASTSRSRHGYQITSGEHELRLLDSSFQGEPSRHLVQTGLYRSSGTAEFRFELPADATHLRLRRRFDAGLPWQAATLALNGRPAGSLPPVAPSSERRWQEVDVDLDVASLPAAGGPVIITVNTLPRPGTPADELEFSEFSWELWCDVDPTLLADGFEAGNAAAWTAVMPSDHSR